MKCSASITANIIDTENLVFLSSHQFGLGIPTAWGWTEMQLNAHRRFWFRAV
jgi:hypothetical protein